MNTQTDKKIILDKNEIYDYNTAFAFHGILSNDLIEEFESHINEFAPEDRNHFTMFNEDYYMIGYWNCEQWLKTHNIGVFNAIEFVQDMEQEQYGESYAKLDNSETLVNNLVYWVGWIICQTHNIPFDRD